MFAFPLQDIERRRIGHQDWLTAGGGIAGIVPNNAHLTWTVEYRHVDRGSINFSFVTPIVNAPGLTLSGVIAVTSRFTDDLVRVGADYHF